MGAEQSSDGDKRKSEKYTKREVQMLMEQQKRMVEEKYRELYLKQQKNEAEATTSLERNRTPYSYSKNDIEIGIAQPTVTNVYPKLDNLTKSELQRNSVASSSATASPFCSPYTQNAVATSTNNNLFKESHSVASTSASPFCSPYTQNAVATSTNNNIFKESHRPSPSAPPASQEPRARSVPRFRNKAQKNDDVDKKLNCPTCKKMLGMKIFNCPRGHSSCDNCKGSMRKCGTCQLPITEMRNITLEQYIGERKSKCPNSDDGCKLYIKMSEMEFHCTECPHREMACPLMDLFGSCMWRGKLPQMVSHFDEMHKAQSQAEVDKEMQLLNISSNDHLVYLVTVGKFHFLFHINVSVVDKSIYIVARLIGTAQSAHKWTYEVQIYNKKEPRRKFTCTDICHSAKGLPCDIFKEKKCIVIPLAYASTFWNEERLTYKFYIKRGTEENENAQRGRGGARRRV